MDDEVQRVIEELEVQFEHERVGLPIVKTCDVNVGTLITPDEASVHDILIVLTLHFAGGDEATTLRFGVPALSPFGQSLLTGEIPRQFNQKLRD